MSKRLELVYLPVEDLKDYDANPRNNTAAIDAVKASILNFGFKVPVVVDANRVIVAGHTRVAAVKRILSERPDLAEDFADVPCFIADDLTPEQLRAFRLVDNKVAEISTWDFDLLAQEVASLGDVGIDMTSFGWSQEELDCLTNVVAVDCLTNAPQPSNDGVDGALRQKRTLGESYDGEAIRISFGSLAFFVLREDFDGWNDKLHRDANFNSEAVIDKVADMLGLKEAKDKRDLIRGSVSGPATASEHVAV